MQMIDHGAQLGYIQTKKSLTEIAEDRRLAERGMGVQEGNLAEKQKPKPEEKTALMKNLIAAGIKPGTPEFSQAVLDSLSKNKTEVNIGGVEKAFEKKFGEKNAEMFFKRKSSAEDAIVSLDAIKEAKTLLDSGIVTGKGAKFLTGFGNALQTIGINIAEDKIANTQAFIAAQAKQTAQLIKAFGAGTGLSDSDREYSERAAGGDISFTEGAIRKILTLNEKAARNSIKYYNGMAASIEKYHPGISPFPLQINIKDDTANGKDNAKDDTTIDVENMTNEQLLNIVNG